MNVWDGCAAWERGSAWAIISKAAVLLALIANRRGPAYLEQLLPLLLAFARQSPAAAQMVRLASPAVISFARLLLSRPHGVLVIRECFQVSLSSTFRPPPRSHSPLSLPSPTLSPSLHLLCGPCCSGRLAASTLQTSLHMHQAANSQEVRGAPRPGSSWRIDMLQCCSWVQVRTDLQ